MRFAAGSIRIEPLAPRHDRSGFTCGKAALDRYIRQQASQDVRRGVASVFVASAPEQPGRILGYFTLSAASVAPAALPPEMARRLPRHPIPAALIGRMAVDLSVARRGLGAILVADAVQKAMAAARIVAVSVIAVDPIDDEARAFYATFGFRALHGPERRMFLALAQTGAV